MAVSARALHRRFLHHVGPAPKQLQRIARFQAFLALTDTGTTRAIGMIAAEASFSDQFHLHRECHWLTGRTPAHAVRVRRAAALAPLASEAGAR